MEDQTFFYIVGAFLYGWICFYLGMKYFEFALASKIADAIMKAAANVDFNENEDVVSNFSGEMHHLRHEIHNGVNFFYYEENDLFACQGATLEEAATNFKETTKGEIIGFFKLEDSEKEYVFVDGEVMHASIQKVKINV